MKEYLIYALTFMAVVVPTLIFGLFPNSEEPQKVKKSSDNTPLLFALTAPLSEFLNCLGLGEVGRMLLPGHSQKLQKDVDFCHLKLKIETIYATQLVGILLLGGAAFAVTLTLADVTASSGAGLLFAFAGAVLPEIVLGNLTQARRTQILQALPYSIDLIASAMHGGLDFSAAVRFYVNLGIPSPLIDEYSQMLREMELGVIRQEALQNMADRLQIKEFSSFASAVILGSELGAPLAETMLLQGEEMRKARFALAECKAQRAPSLMLLPMALFILPAVFVVIFVPVYLKMKESGVSIF